MLFFIFLLMSKIVLGIDGGLANVGIALVDLENNTIIASQTIKTDPHSKFRVKFITSKIKYFYESLKIIPIYAVVERSVIGINKKSSIDLAMSLGAIILSLEQALIPYYFISPTEVKKNATGIGNASKEDIRKALSDKGFNLENRSHHEIDAIVLCFSKKKF